MQEIFPTINVNYFAIPTFDLNKRRSPFHFVHHHSPHARARGLKVPNRFTIITECHCGECREITTRIKEVFAEAEKISKTVRSVRAVCCVPQKSCQRKVTKWVMQTQHHLVTDCHPSPLRRSTVSVQYAFTSIECRERTGRWLLEPMKKSCPDVYE